jgi:hypothetical protein
MTNPQARAASPGTGDDTAATGVARLPEDLVPIVIGVTGHRDLVPGEVPQLRQRVREMLVGLTSQYPDLPVAVMSRSPRAPTAWWPRRRARSAFR